MGKRLYSINDLVKQIGATKWFWRTQIWAGKLPNIQVGRTIFVDQVDIENFIQKHKINSRQNCAII